MAGLTHFDAKGDAHMVDVSGKPVSLRTATAAGFVQMSAATVEIVRSGTAAKGDVLAVARLAGIMAAKRTSDLIPLCHPLPLDKVSLELQAEAEGVAVQATVATAGRTGVEMEALTAVSVACLTIYDMLKAVERGMRIERIRLIHKDGGKSGLYRAP
jgi:cyclic pyranopterin phosphate synthase